METEIVKENNKITFEDKHGTVAIIEFPSDDIEDWIYAMRSMLVAMTFNVKTIDEWFNLE